jgi:RNA polymerase sigma factor (sigma-70 family)
MDKQDKIEFAELVATAVVNALEKKGIINPVTPKPKTEKTAYQKTEQLLFNYNGFKRIVAEKQQEIADLRMYGVPQKSGCAGGGERVQTSRTVQGIVLPEESVENAVRAVEASVQGTVQAIALIDKCMAALKGDPYYRILEMRYFEGRTQEDIALELNCSQVTISKNKSRLVKDLAMRLFPNQVIEEYMN